MNKYLSNRYDILFITIILAAFLINYIGKAILLSSTFIYLFFLLYKKERLLFGNRSFTLLVFIQLILSIIHIIIFQELSVDYFTPIFYFFLLPDLTSRIKIQDNKNSSLLYLIFYFFIFLGLIRVLKIGFDFNQLNFYFYNKNTASMIFELIAGFLLLKNKKKSFALLSLLGLMAIGGKTSIILFFFFSIIVLYPTITENRTKNIVGAITIIGIVFGVFSMFPYELIKTLFYRFNIWDQALDEIYKNLLVGNGINSFRYNTNEFGLFGKEAIHNYYLQQFHSFGLILGLSNLLLILFSFKQIRTRDKKMFLIMFILHAFVDVGWVYGPGIIYGLFIGNLYDKNEI